MKAHLIELVRAAPDPVYGTNLAREYLQARILGALQRSGAMLSLAFHGGTALRFLYGMNRFSEDLDFALERAPERYDFRRSLQAVRSELAPEGYTVELKLNDRRTVHNAFIRFPGLLHELGLSPHASQVLAVKIEVDTRPPAGATLETTVVRRHVLLHLQHHDRASLLAGKLHAVLQRPFVKGRDLFDLLWYLSDPTWPAPNLAMLNQALAQTDWDGPVLDERNWRDAVRERLQAVAWSQALADVAPFLEPGFDPALLSRENLERLLRPATDNR